MTLRDRAGSWTPRLTSVAVVAITAAVCLPPSSTPAFPIGSAAWNDADWSRRCQTVRTSYNPTGVLSNTRLTLQSDDPRFLDFLYWVWANKIIEHQVEQIGGTEWNGPTTGVIFHWAPGSRWETHTVVPLQHAIQHLTEEHHWQDNMFVDFFERFGPIRGVGIGQRLSTDTPPTWAQFLAHVGGPDSPYYRYIFHQESAIDADRRAVRMVGGQGVVFEYSFERYLTEIREVVTDCKAFQFFQLYDRYGHGFASRAGWAGQPLPKAPAR
jgi:hypothetical protein